MKHTIELDKNDIKKIIAKEFNVDEGSITITIKQEYEGDGYYPVKKYEVYASIITNS